MYEIVGCCLKCRSNNSFVFSGSLSKDSSEYTCLNCGNVAYSGLNISVDFSKEIEGETIPDILTSAQASRYFSITNGQLDIGERDGYLHPDKQNGRRFFHRGELESYRRQLETV